MKAVKFENRAVSFIDVPTPEIADDEALVKISLAGICGTDIAIYHGYADFSGIAGHEFTGTVHACPAAPEWIGKRVVADINIGCGQCPACRCRDARHCPDRTVIGIRGRNGAFAQYCKIPVANLHPVPENVESICAVFAEPLAAALEITQQIHICHSASIAVIGDGKLGILTALGLAHFSGGVCLIGRHEDKLAVAARQGIRTISLPADANPETLKNQFAAFDVTVDATGSPDGINWALALTRPKGTVVIKTTPHEATALDLATVAVNELHLIGSRCGDLDMALRFLQHRRIDVMPLVEAVYPFSRFDDAFAHAGQSTSLKVLLAFSEDDFAPD